MGWHEEWLRIFTSVCCNGALTVLPLFLNSELVVGAVTELWAAENTGAGDDNATVVDTEDEVMG